MTDLQCPATVLFFARELIVTRECGRVLGASRLSGVFLASSLAMDPQGLSLASSLAEHGCCPLDIVANVADGPSLVEAVEQLADLYRGETIAVIATLDVLRDILRCSSAPTQPITVAIDASGWAVVNPA